MNKLIRLIPIAIFILTNHAFAQKFLDKTAQGPKTFQQIQREFNAWKKTADLKHEKGWKYFKRWEMETALHTDGHGTPVDPKVYIDAVTQVAAEKQRSALARTSTVSWLPSGPNAVPDNLTGYLEVGIGRINCIAFHPSDPATYFVGVAQGGVWKTTNNGLSWTPLTDNLPVIRVSDIAIDPINPDVMYIAVGDFEYIGFGLNLNGRKRNTHYGLGIYKTTDGGVNWSPTGLSYQLTGGDASLIRKTIINQTNTNQLIACGSSGLYVSNDAGATWVQKMDSLFWDMVQDPSNQNVIYAASGWVKNADDGYAAIYKSTDFGSTWSMLSTGIPGTGTVQRIKLAIAPSNTNYVYALAVDQNSAMYGIYKTTNGGTSWNLNIPSVNILDGSDGSDLSYGQGTYDLAIFVNPTDPDIIYTGGVNVWGSIDGGQTFNPASHWTIAYGPTVHADIHFMQIQPSTGNLFVCNDGGLYRTSNLLLSTWVDANNGVPWPTQWSNLSNGMQTTSFYRLSSSKNLTGRLIAGAQDNSTSYFDGTSWYSIFGGDGMDNYLDPADDFYIIGSSQYGNFYQSYDGGFSANGLQTNPFGEVAEWTTPIVADYANPGTLYLGNSNVYQSIDNGNSWNQISSFPFPGIGDNEISALDVSPVSSTSIVAAKRVRYEYAVPGSVQITTNGGGSWTDVTAGLPDSLYYTSVNFDPYSASKLYITMAGFVAGEKVYSSSNAGASWQNISYNLPNIPVNCVKVIPGTSDLIAATDIGVYVLDSGSVNWVLQSNGLPNVIVTDIEFNEAQQRIYVSTFGRGIWSLDLGMLLHADQGQLFAKTIDLFPTLSRGSFTVRLNDSKAFSGNCTMTVVDVTGRTVLTKNYNGAGEYKEQVNLMPGMYYARFSDGKSTAVKNFIIQ